MHMKTHSIVGHRNTPAPLIILTALSALFLGFLYYGLFRDHPMFTYIPGFLEHRVVVTQWLSVGYEVLWLPSFLHAFATFLFVSVLSVAGCASVKSGCRVWVLGALMLFELFIGVTDKFDILAIFAGALCAELVAGNLRTSLSKQPLQFIQTTTRRRHYQRFSVLGVVTLSGLLAAGSGLYGFGSEGGGSTSQSFDECARFENGNCIEFKQAAAPVYMSYQELRESVSVEVARAPVNIGRVYLYLNYVLLNERNEGIHIIDNSDPSLPINLGFIRIPGNTDIEMRSNYLFADSYTDLITLDLNDPANIQVVNRQESLFPYNAYQNIPYNISLLENGIDSRLGVVVSYHLSGN